MKSTSLTDLIEKLKSTQRVKGVFCAGTTATKLTSSSDIDLIIILDKNSEGEMGTVTIGKWGQSRLFPFPRSLLSPFPLGGRDIS